MEDAATNSVYALKHPELAVAYITNRSRIGSKDKE